MANLSENRLNQALDAEFVTNSIDAINEVIANLPEGVLNDDQRRRYTGMDVDNRVFVETVLNVLSGSGASVLPASFSLVRLQNDDQFFMQVGALSERTTALQKKLDDLSRIVSHEAYTYSLVIYKLYEAQSEAGVEEARAGYELMRARFEGQGGNIPNPPSP